MKVNTIGYTWDHKVAAILTAESEVIEIPSIEENDKLLTSRNQIDWIDNREKEPGIYFKIEYINAESKVL